MKRTIDIMTVARAKGVELPAEWWSKHQSCPKCNSDNLRSVFASPTYRCRACGSKWLDKHLERNGAEFFCGPDLELPENIHHAFTVADALGDWPVDVRYTVGKFEVFFFFTLDTGEVKIGRGTAPERHLALIAACEAALGIERGEAGA